MALPAGRYGVTKNQLLKIKKLPMNTIKLIEELTEKFNLLGSAAFKNFTSVVTDSSDLVESGAVYTALQGKCDNSVIAPVENGTTVQKSGGYAVGSHAIRNGAFITWKNAKAQGETINDASDYTAGDVADCLTVKYSAITSSNPSISINPISKVIKSGNIAEIILIFTTDNAISATTDICDLPFEPYMTNNSDNMLFDLKTLTAPFSNVGYSLYSGWGSKLRFNPGNTPLPAGDYYVTGTYICK